MTKLVNERAENAVLGAMLLRNEEIPKVQEVLETSDFHKHDNQLIARLIFEVHGKGRPVDAVTVGAMLGPELQDAAGAVFLLDRILEGTPNPMNAVYYAEIVKDLSNRRKVHMLCQTLLKKLPDTNFTVHSMLDRFHLLAGEIVK